MRAKLRYLSDEQIKQLSNGCGNKSKFVSVPSFIFRASCDKHDVLYLIGGSEADRKKADDAFYYYMKIDADMYSGLQRLKYRAIAYIYYKAVRLFGREFFCYGEPKTLEDLMELLCKTEN